MNRDFDGNNNRSSLSPNRGRRFGWVGILFWLAIIIIFSLWIFGGLGGANAPTTISYSDFRQQLQNDNVSQIVVEGKKITGELVISATIQSNGQTLNFNNFVTYLPSFGDNELLNLLDTHHVKVITRPVQNFSWLQIILTVGPFLFLIVIGYMFVRQMRNRGQDVFSIGKSRAKLYDHRQERTTFKDVAGIHGAKSELQEIIEFLRDPTRFERLGGEMPKGVLLVGPPGTGKTLLARAVAGEANVPFFSITGSDFMEMFVGVGASRVRDLFRDAKKSAPSIVFIDELDSIGRRRGTGLGGSHDEREQTLNQMLSEMDGFEPNTNVIVMAATNRPDILDPALLRPGRFDRRITVDLPTARDREEILKIHSRNKPLAQDVDLSQVARGTPGLSGADLENLLNEAALLAARQGKDKMYSEDIDAAKDKIILGLERKNLVLSDEDCRTLAFHESGHAIVAAVAPNADPVHKVTIVPRGHAMGVTQQLPKIEKYIYTRAYVMDRLAVMMGGRASEELFLESITSGAENDLK